MMNTVMLLLVNMRPVDLVGAEALIATIVPIVPHWISPIDDEYDQYFDDEYDQSFLDEYAQL